MPGRAQCTNQLRIVGAKRPPGPPQGLRRERFKGGEVQKQGFVSSKMIENRKMKSAIPEESAHIAGVETGQGKKTPETLVVARQIGERAQRQFVRRGIRARNSARRIQFATAFH